MVKSKKGKAFLVVILILFFLSILSVTFFVKAGLLDDLFGKGKAEDVFMKHSDYNQDIYRTSDGSFKSIIYPSQVNVKTDNGFVAVEDYINVSEENSKVKISIDGKDCYIEPIYELTDSKEIPKLNINITKNRGSWYFTTNIDKEINSMSYNLNCSDYNIYYDTQNDKLLLDSVSVDFSQAKNLQNISTTFKETIQNVTVKDELGTNVTTSKTIQTLEFKAVDGKIADLKTIDPVIRYNATMPLNSLAFSTSGYNGLLPPIDGPIPSATYTDITGAIELTKNDNTYKSITFGTSGNNYKNFFLFYFKYNIPKEDIEMINFTWAGKTSGGSYGSLTFFVWNSTSWNQFRYMSSDSDIFVNFTQKNVTNYINNSNYSHFIAQGNLDGFAYGAYTDYVQLEIGYDGLILNTPSTNQVILNSLSTTLNTSQSGYNNTVWYTLDSGKTNKTLCTNSNECQGTINFPTKGYYNLTVYANKSDGTITSQSANNLFVTSYQKTYLNLTKDTYISNKVPSTDFNKNYGANTYWVLDTQSTWSLLQFDMSSIPYNSSITSAFIHGYSGTSSGTWRTVNITALTRDWMEGGGTSTTNTAIINGTTWMERWYENNGNDGCLDGSDPDWCNNGTSINDYNATLVSNNSVSFASSGWFIFNITNAVQWWTNGLTNYGVILKPQGASASTNIYNRTRSPLNQRPFVNITFDYPQPVFSNLQPANNSVIGPRTISVNCTSSIKQADSYANITNITIYISKSKGYDGSNLATSKTFIYNSSSNPIWSNNVTANWSTTLIEEVDYYWWCETEVMFETGQNLTGVRSQENKLNNSALTLTVNYPVSTNYKDIYDYKLPLSATTSGTTVDTIWYTLDKGKTNITYTAIVNMTNLVAGQNTLIVYANDTVGTEKNKTIYFNLTFTPKINKINVSNVSTSYTREGNLTGLVGWWSFDENRTDLVLDKTGISNASITSPRNLWISNGIIGGAFNFTPNYDSIRVNIGNLSKYSYGNITDKPFTIMGWAKRDDDSNVDNSIISNLRYNAGCTGRYGISCGGFDMRVYNNQFLFRIIVSNSTYDAPPNQCSFNYYFTPGIGNWHFYSVTHNGTRGTNVSIYVDGINVPFTSSSCNNWYLGNEIWGAVIPSEGLLIGQNTHSGSGFNGSIDEVRIYNRSLSLDEIKSIYYVTNPTFQKGANTTINVTITDEDTPSSSLYYSWYVNSVSVLTGFAQNVLNYLFTNINSIVTVTINDTNNYNVTQTFNITTNYTLPIIAFIPNTPVNNSGQQSSDVIINVTINSTNFQASWVNFNNINYSMSCTGSNPYICNKTINNQINGTYNYTVYANDTWGSISNSESRIIVIDTIKPIVNITSPIEINNSYRYGTTQVIRIDVNETNKGSCWYKKNADNNVSYDCINGGNIAGFVYGQNNLTIFANDTAGNLGSTSIVFTVDNIVPTIDYGVGTSNDGVNVSRNWIFINVTLGDKYFSNVTFNLYDSSYSLVSSIRNATLNTNYSYSQYIYNFTDLEDGIYYYNVTVLDRAFNENTTSTRRIMLDNDIPQINLTYPLVDMKNITLSHNFTANISDNLGIKNATLYIYDNISSYAVKFNSVNGYINIPYNQSFNWTNTNAFTFSAWVYRVGDGLNGIVSQYSSGATRTSLFYFSSSTLALNIYHNGTGSNVTAVTYSTPELNNWHNVIGTWNGSVVSLYYDGILVKNTTATMGNTIFNYINPIVIGGISNVNYVFNGSIDEVRIYNRSITSSEAQEIYFSGLLRNSSLNSSGLVAWYDFEPISDWSRLIDVYSGRFNGTISGNATYSNAIKSYSTNLNGVLNSIVGFVNTLVDGVYKWTYSAFDWAGNFFIAQNRTLYLDSKKPNLSIIVPSSFASYKYNQSFNFNYTLSELNLNSCWYKLNIDSSNTSIVCGQNFTRDLAEGNYNISIYANDTYGNLGGDSHRFFISIIPPAVNMIYPDFDNWLNYTDNIRFNFTADDANLVDTCELWGNWTGTWKKNQTIRDINDTEYTISNYLNLTEGYYQWGIWCNDSSGDSGFKPINYTFGIDTHYPTIDYGVGTSNDGVNVSRNWIFINVTATETNEQGITFHLYDSSLNILNETTYTDKQRTINWTELSDGLYYYNVTIIDKTGRLNETSLRGITLDIHAPTYDFNYPNDKINTSTNSFNFSINISNFAIKNATFFLYNRTGLVSNVTFTFVTGTATATIGAVVTLVDTVYDWFYKIFDWTENAVTTTNRTLTVDTLNPGIEYDASTQADVSWSQSGDVLVNVSVIELNLDSALLYWQGVPESFSFISSNNHWKTKTGLATGTYQFYAYANDSAGNENQTDIRTVYVDRENPVITIHNPINDTNYNTNVSLLLNISQSDVNLQACWYNIDGGSNVSMTCNQTTYFNISQGTNHTIYSFANDSSGRIGIAFVTFDINSAKPSLSLDYPDDNIWLTSQSINFKYTPNTAYEIDTCKLYINSSGTFQSEDTRNEIEKGNQQIVPLTLSDSAYIWNVWCNDTFSNSIWGKVNSNRTLYIDSVKPNITYGYGTENSGMNFTRNNLFINVSAQDLNEANITFRIYQSTDLSTPYLVYNYTDKTRSINVTLADGIYYYNVTIIDKANQFNSTETRKIGLDNNAPSIIIDSPESNPGGKNGYNHNTPSLNYTAIDSVLGLNTCWYNIYNLTYDGFIDSLITDNTTLINCQNISLSLPSGDIDYSLNLWTNDTLNNIVSSSIIFGIRTIPPSITLIKPTNNFYFKTNTSLLFNFTTIDIKDGINAVDTCELWGNWTGTWKKNQTKKGTIFTTTNFNPLTIQEGNYIWNVKCNDSYNNVAWGETINRTLGVDITYPQVNILNPVSGSSITSPISLIYNISDLNIDTCYYNFLDTSTNTWISTSSNYTLNNCSATSQSVSVAVGNYNFYVWAKDKAGNVNSSNISINIKSSVIIVPGSGGGGTTSLSQSILATNYSLLSPGLLPTMDIILAKDSVKARERDLIIVNTGKDEFNIKVYCDITNLEENQSSINPNEINICDYVKFEKDTYIVSPNQDRPTVVKMFVSVPENATFGDIYSYNIIAQTLDNLQYSKVSVTARTPFYAIFIYKWKFIPLSDEKSMYPVVAVAVSLSILTFVITFGFFNYPSRKRKYPAVGLLLGVILSILTFILVSIYF